MEKITLVIHPDRTVSQKEAYVDTLKTREQDQQRAKDQDHIYVIRDAIEKGFVTVRAMNTYCKEGGVGVRITDRVRKTYKGIEWDAMPGTSHNSLEFYLLERDDEWDIPA